jgi:hypothetical protein
MASSGRFIGQSFIEISHGPCKRTRQRLSGSCEGIVLAVDIGGHREAGRGTAEPLRDDGWGTPERCIRVPHVSSIVEPDHREPSDLGQPGEPVPTPLGPDPATQLVHHDVSPRAAIAAAGGLRDLQPLPCLSGLSDRREVARPSSSGSLRRPRSVLGSPSTTSPSTTVLASRIVIVLASRSTSPAEPKHLATSEGRTG